MKEKNSKNNQNKNILKKLHKVFLILTLKLGISTKKNNDLYHKINELNYKIAKQNRELEKLTTKFENERRKTIYYIHKYLPIEKREEALKDWFAKATGSTLNLENPKTFNEKIQWLKLYDSTPIKTKLADKYLVRDWVKEKIGEKYLIPLLGVYDNFDEINFDELPNQFVIKCNHGCGYNIIVKDKTNFNKNSTRKKINNWMQENFAFHAGFQMHYENIPKKIIIEEYIRPEISNIEIQSWCFNGELKFISYETDKNTENSYRAIFTPEWESENFTITSKERLNYSQLPQKPKYLDELKNIVNVLCQDFKHVRIDFIVMEDKLYFREMTFTSASGLSKFEPEDTKYRLGEMIKL